MCACREKGGSKDNNGAKITMNKLYHLIASFAFNTLYLILGSLVHSFNKHWFMTYYL